MDCNAQDDDVITRKILINDTDDRRLQMLQTLIIKWVVTDYNSVNDSVRTYNDILAILSQVISTKRKSQMIHKRTQQEVYYYQDLTNTLEEKIRDIKDLIETSKVLLSEVQKEYKKKFAYNALLKELEEVPNRDYIKNSLKALKTDFKYLKYKFNEINDDQATWEEAFEKFQEATVDLSNKIGELKTENQTAFKKIKRK